MEIPRDDDLSKVQAAASAGAGRDRWGYRQQRADAHSERPAGWPAASASALSRERLWMALAALVLVAGLAAYALSAALWGRAPEPAVPAPVEASDAVPVEIGAAGAAQDCGPAPVGTGAGAAYVRHAPARSFARPSRSSSALSAASAQPRSWPRTRLSINPPGDNRSERKPVATG